MRIRRVVADNAGPFTGPGTNTWLIDDAGHVVIIDPGPIDPRHQDRIIEMIEEQAPQAVLVTHTHSDHAPLANPLARDLDVPALGHAPGPDFDPDLVLEEGSRLRVGGDIIEVIHTPGHADDHLCFRVGNALFTGDHIMGGSSVMVEDLGSYLDSLAKLKGIGLERLHPGHGDEMDRPDEVIDWYLAHRAQRHEQILEAIRGGAGTTCEIVETVYRDVDRSLHPLAARSVEAHVTLLLEQGRIASSHNQLVALPPNP